jgi:hypothetical protein
VFEKYLQKTIEREEARDKEWAQRHKKTKVKTFFYEYDQNMCDISNAIVSMMKELEFQKNLERPSLSRIKKLSKKLERYKVQNPEIFLTLEF